jgi:hypothetical protein
VPDGGARHRQDSYRQDVTHELVGWIINGTDDLRASRAQRDG